MVSRPEVVPGGTVTGTEIVQVPGAAGVPAGIVPPFKVIVVDVVVTVPPHVFVIVPPATTVIGVGKVSVKLAPVYAELFGFCKVMFRVEVPPAGKLDGEKPFVPPISRTFNRAVAALLFVRFSLFWSPCAGIRFVYAPCTLEVTLTVIVQVVPDGMVPLFKVTEDPPLAAVTPAEPPHPLNVADTGLARNTLAGRGSVMDAPVRVTVAPLVMAMVN